MEGTKLNQISLKLDWIYSFRVGFVSGIGPLFKRNKIYVYTKLSIMLNIILLEQCHIISVTDFKKKNRFYFVWKGSLHHSTQPFLNEVNQLFIHKCYCYNGIILIISLLIHSMKYYMRPVSSTLECSLISIMQCIASHFDNSYLIVVVDELTIICRQIKFTS